MRSESSGAAVAGQSPVLSRQRAWPPALTAAALAVAVAAILFTVWRLFQGMDLLDESFYVAVPYRWAVGSKPFADETNILQIAGFLSYPFVKLFVAVTGGATGIMLFMRVVWFVFALGVATAVFGILRTLTRWQYALLIAAVYVSFVLFDLPQVSYNTLGAGFLTLGVALALWTIVHGRSRWWLVAAGAAHGLAAVGFLAFIAAVPLYAVFLALALRAAPSIGARWRALLTPLAAYVGGAAAVGAAALALIMSFGWSNVRRSIDVSLQVAKGLGQAGGLSKALDVLRGYERLLWSRPYLVLALVVLLLVVLRWPAWGRAALVLLPLPLWLAGQRDLLEGPGMCIVYAFLAPCLYLFVPADKRPLARTLLLWGALPALLAGWLAAFASAEGYGHSQVGLMPALMVSGIFVAWGLEAVAADALSPAVDSAREVRRSVLRALPTVALAAIVAVTVVFQFQFIPRNVPYSQLTVWMGQGPYWGLHTTQKRKAYLDEFARDLHAQARPGDSVLVMYQFPGAYLYWPGAVVSNSVWISNADETGPLPPPTIAYFDRHHAVPDLVLRIIHSEGLTPTELLQRYCAGFPYDVVVQRSAFAILRRPAGQSVAQTIRDLSARTGQ